MYTRFSKNRPPGLRSGWLILLLSFLCLSQAGAASWWNNEWTIRKKVTVDAGASGGSISEPIGTCTVLLRLHDGNFDFASSKDDGTDLRFVTSDDKTVLPYHIEKYDSLLNEAFVWVKIPDIKPGAATSIWMYYGNTADTAGPSKNTKDSFDADTILVWHFGEKNAPPVDASASGVNGTDAGITVEGSMIGSGIKLDGNKGLTIPASPKLNTVEGGAFTWSAWVKPSVLSTNQVVFSWHDGSNSLVIGLDNGVAYVEITGSGGTQRSTIAPNASPFTPNVWRLLAVVTSFTQATVYVDGEVYATASAGMPALTTAALLGRDGTPGTDAAAGAPKGFVGELDELNMVKTARPAGFLKLQALGQSGSDKAASVFVTGVDEAHGSEGEISKHLSLISDISKSLTFDGWVVIGLCALLAVVGWIVTIDKLLYLSKINKATGAFLKQWKHIARDLTALNHADKESISSMGGKASAKMQRLMRQSPLFHIYHLGSDEIQHRVDSANGNFKGLSGRSMQAIRASLEGGLTREIQNLNSKLVFLTIGIAGGPYLGLLGTVIGVMITFAVIAKSGAVEVNSIAPGIAGALLATVAGLAVAIPALFAYSYVNSRIKDVISEMQTFIEEFVAKIAEFYPAAGE